MCYSAQVEADFRRYTREWGASLSIDEFVKLFWWKWDPDEIRRHGKPKIPKALERAFLKAPRTDDEVRIARYITLANGRQATEWQQELFAQRARLVNAEHQLAVKPTKKAADDQRIATKKMASLKGWLDDLQRTEALDRDSRIFPGWYAPVMVVEGGRRVVKPMRYQCRPPGAPAAYDQRYPGTYNARRDNLQGPFWRSVFGYTHGVMLVDRFYENVDRDGSNVVLEFVPADRRPMLVACLWSKWVGADGDKLLSFAAITDEPPPEVAAAGHDRCIVPIKAEYLDLWLNPQGTDPATLDAILEDRERPYYEHRLAA
ncbi:SOS response-associated peptidase family protein [Aquincola sp. MAHUQ-54]|uniref:Abasic site processing protein n=1 Tax=Aquincola agrisoli TaxID=3119538 RepID=A0AAW9QMU5_9BURK